MSERKKGLELGPAIRKSKGEPVTAVINLLPDGEATITLKYLDPEDMRTLRKRAQTAAWDIDKKQFDAFEEKKQFDVLLADEAVAGFTGMLVDGEDVPYSKENARMLMLHSFIFGEAVHRNVSDVRHFIKKGKDAEKEGTLKNLERTSGR